MPDIGDAYYPADIEPVKRGIPEGRYSSKIISLEVINNVSCGSGKYIADIFKPEYLIDPNEHPEYKGESVMDNGIFRYRKSDGYIYEPKKNWGYAKFMTIANLYKSGSNSDHLPFLELNDIKGAVVLIDVFMKKFVNEYEKDVRYPVARAVQFTKPAEAPF